MKKNANKRFLTADVHFNKGKLWDTVKPPKTDKEAKRMYWLLGPEGRLAFDNETGINFAADPEIGGAYTMATGYDLPGFAGAGARTWNFHWAGVVMKDGRNNVTLENYAVSYGTSDDPAENQRLQQKAYDEVNRGWVYQMYGMAKTSQTFRGQHLASGTHGNRGSTFAVKAD